MNTIRPTYDYVIAGAGCSGLSLAWHIVQYPELQQKRILIADPDFSIRNDKTWCFWNSDAVPEQVPVFKRWKQARVLFPSTHKEEAFQNISYACVRSGDYASEMKRYLENYTQIDWIEEGITDIQQRDDHVIVQTEAGQKVSSTLLFNSFDKPRSDSSKFHILQHFMGWDITVEKDVFNPDSMTLMDFRIPQVNGATFMYVLPFTKRKALVEYTLFNEEILNKKDYESAIQNYIHSYLGLTNFTLDRSEFGVIPMADRLYNQGIHPNVINIGTTSGLPKASTGYTFSRIHRHSAFIAHALSEGKSPFLKNPSAYRYRAYDLLLLDILKDQKNAIIPVFEHLFKHNTIENVLTFLDEKTTFPEDLKIMYSVPWKPFLSAIGKNIKLLSSGL